MRFFTLLFLLSCTIAHAQKKKKKENCGHLAPSNYFSKAEIEEFVSIIDSDTTYLRQAKFKCTNSSFYTKKVMFDHFGKWDKTLFSSEDEHPILIWEQVYLFDDGKLYTIAALGEEDLNMTYGAVLVFDKDGNDVLNDLEISSNVLEYFGKAIRASDIKKRDFYEVYWRLPELQKWAPASFKN